MEELNIKEIEKNKELIKKYPWIWPVDYNFKPIPESEYNYSFTMLDCEFPKGWKDTFGEQMCEDIKKVLVKYKLEDNFKILQLKEKFGSMRLYFAGLTKSEVSKKCNEELREVINKYENISSKTCHICGKPARYLSQGWICPYCEECAENYMKENEDSIENINKYFVNI